MATEQTLQKNIVKYLEDQGCYVVKVISASKAGVHDIIGCYNGVFFSIEVKTPQTRNNVSKLQKYNVDLVHRAGGQSLVAWDVDMVKDFVSGLLV